MNTRLKRLIVVLLSVLLILATVNPTCFAMAQSKKQTTVNLGNEQQLQEEVKQKLDTIAVPFVENKGQVTDKKVKYIADTIMGKAYVTDEGIEYAVLLDECATFIKEKFKGKNIMKAEGIDRSETKINYFRGNDKSKWLKDIASYDAISYGQVYDNIEVNLKAYNNNIEKFFKVNPGGAPEDIQIEVLGATGLGVTEPGELEIHLQDGAIKMSKPIAFQIINGKKQNVQAEYVVNDNEYGFKVGKYDKTLPLIIDPFIASTFFGGSGEDQLTSMVIDKKGNIYIAGHTKSSDFPNKSDREYTRSDNYFEWEPMFGYGDPPEPPTGFFARTTYEVFVSKLNKDMTKLLASTYIGGNENDYAYALTVDDKGNVYVAGRTTSTGIRPYGDDYIPWKDFEYNPDDWEDEWDPVIFEIEPPTAFPTTEGAYQTEPLTDRGFNNYFVTKLNSDLNNINASTLLGEGTDGKDGINGIKIDGNGDILVVGGTGNPGGFAVAGDPTYEPLYRFVAGDDGKGRNGFIAKFNDSLTEIKGYTFLGGGGTLHGAFRDNGTFVESIVLDSQDNIYVTGSTADTDFPTTDNAFCRVHSEKGNNSPGDDAFIAKLDNNLDTLISSTLLGGKSSDGGVDIKLDTDGNVFITGTTMSEDFPVGKEAYQENLKKHLDNTYHDIFISKFDNSLSELLAGTYIGGQNREDVFGLALDESFVYVTGSTKGEYPTTDNSSGYIIISQLNKNLTELEASTLLGENGDEGRVIIAREDGIYVAGRTSSINFPVTDGAYHELPDSKEYKSKYVFITKFGEESSEEKPKYDLIVEEDDIYEVQKTESGMVLTINEGIEGFKYLGVSVKTINEHLGEETVVFTHLREGKQTELNSIKADFDTQETKTAQSGFNVKPGDMIKIYIVDDLTNDTKCNPIILL